jgi:hypothetical protein
VDDYQLKDEQIDADTQRNRENTIGRCLFFPAKYTKILTRKAVANNNKNGWVSLAGEMRRKSATSANSGIETARKPTMNLDK